MSVIAGPASFAGRGDLIDYEFHEIATPFDYPNF